MVLTPIKKFKVWIHEATFSKLQIAFCRESLAQTSMCLHGAIWSVAFCWYLSTVAFCWPLSTVAFCWPLSTVAFCWSLSTVAFCWPLSTVTFCWFLSTVAFCKSLAISQIEKTSETKQLLTCAFA